MRQHEIMIGLEQDQMLAQAVFPFTRRGAAPSHRRYALTQAEIEPLHKRRIDLPSVGGQHLIDRHFRAEDPVELNNGT